MEKRNPSPPPVLRIIIKISIKLQAISLEQTLVMESKLSRKKKIPIQDYSFKYLITQPSTVTFPPHSEGLKYSECKSTDQKLFSVYLQNNFKEQATEEEKKKIHFYSLQFSPSSLPRGNIQKSF